MSELKKLEDWMLEHHGRGHHSTGDMEQRTSAGYVNAVANAMGLDSFAVNMSEYGVPDGKGTIIDAALLYLIYKQQEQINELKELIKGGS